MGPQQRLVGALVIVVAVLLPLFLAPVFGGAGHGPPTPLASSAIGNGDPTTHSTRNPSYAILFVQTGLTGGTWWAINLSGVSRSTQGEDLGISFSEPNGSYPFQATSTGYAADPTSGTILVAGGSIEERIVFSSPPHPYDLTFVESGLPEATPWSMTVNGTTEQGTSGNITFSELNGTYAYSVTPLPGFETTYIGSVIIAGANVSVPIAFSAAGFPLTFAETGLAPGTPWTVTVENSTEPSTSATIVVQETNGTYAYEVEPIAGYVTEYSGNVTVDGAPVVVHISFAVAHYGIAVVESGLPAATAWTVAVGDAVSSSNSTTIEVLEPNGSYSVSIGTQAEFQANPAGLSVSVRGSDLNVTVVFAPKSYEISFVEAGLPDGTAWQVTVDGANRSAISPDPITVPVANGAHNYTVVPIAGYVVTAWTGTFAIAGANDSLTVSFSPFNYSVVFDTAGLPIGTPWNASLNGTERTSTTSIIVFEVPNGTYAFTTSTPSQSWQTLEETGTVSVDGSDGEVSIAFEYAYPVTFRVGSLPAGVTWFVNLTGNLSVLPTSAVPHGPVKPITYLFSSSSTALSFPLPNGSYTYTVSSNLLGWTPRTTSSNLTVQGASPPPVTVQSPAGPGNAGVPWLTWSVIGAAIVAVVAVSALGYRSYVLRPPPAGGPDALDELYLSYDLVTEVDPATIDGSPDVLDDIF